MRTRNLLVSTIVSASLAITGMMFAKEHDEENLNSSAVPAAVQRAAESEAKGGKIVRWEKEHGKYEAVIDKGGKEWGVVIDDKGKVLSKHDESKEKGEKEEHEKH